jgi:hypothetical protein
VKIHKPCRGIICLLFLAALCAHASKGSAQLMPQFERRLDAAVDAAAKTASSAPPSISLSPAVVMVKGKPGQTFSQEITIWNNTPIDLAFTMQAVDVMVKNGKRVFLPGEDVNGGIARNAVFSSSNMIATAGSFASTRVTVTIPAVPSSRAIACIFLGKTILQTRDSVALTGSLGALVTFTLADDFRVESQPLEVNTDLELKSISFHQVLTNSGTDPIVPKGVIAVLNQSGSMVTRLPVTSQRLLPGETVEFSAEHSGLFKAGTYRAFFLIENEKAFFSNETQFIIK